MKIISFSWTTAAVKARRKSVTRRKWNDKYAAQFHKGDLIQAYNKSPRNGGKPFGLIRLTEEPFKESTADISVRDYEGEGFIYLEQQRITLKGVEPWQIWDEWLEHPQVLWVVRFEVIKIFPEKQAI